jgi:hypothetical protein
MRAVLKAVAWITPIAWVVINGVFWILDRIENVHTVQYLWSHVPEIMQPVIYLLSTWYFPAVICLLSLLGIWILDRRRDSQKIVTGSPVIADPPLSAKERVPTNVPPEYLISLFKEHTSAEVKRIIAPYIGKWMEVSGPVLDVSDHSSFSTVTIPAPASQSFTRVYMYFRQPDRSHIVSLRPGTEVTVLGQLENVYSVQVELNHCELISLP